jgi:hypothetical protein
MHIQGLHYFFGLLCIKAKNESKQLKQKKLKIQKQEKEKCFANLKEQEDSQWCNLP